MKKVLLTSILFSPTFLFAQSYYDDYERGGGLNFFSWIIVLLVCILIFLICREIVCWYWKINQSIELQKKILEKLDKMDTLDDISYELKNLRFEINRRAKEKEENKNIPS